MADSPCLYPGCPETPTEDAPKARAGFCFAHMSQKCLYAQIGQCDSLVVAGSGWCKQHNDEVVRFDYIHAIRHNQKLQQQMAQQQLESVRSGLVIPGNGKG